MFSQCGNVQQKISCVYDTVVLEEQSTKRAHQSYRVVAGDTVRDAATAASIESARPSEKLDGTCVLVEKWQGKPWLYARHDRKPNKAADKRFKKFQTTKRLKLKLSVKALSDPQSDTTTGATNSKDQAATNGPCADDLLFKWDVVKDFKDVPAEWIPASGVSLVDGVPQPDTSGHILGWVPVNPNERLHCWHLTTVDLDSGFGLVLEDNSPHDKQHSNTSSMQLEIKAVPLEKLLGCTMELIGTFINANPYGIGSKQAPLHLLVKHGAVSFVDPPSLDYVKLKSWLEKEADGQVEGVVWHCSNGDMFKLHRHHVQLKWPIAEPRLLSIPVSICLEQFQPKSKSLFDYLCQLNDKTFPSLSSVQYLKPDK